MVKSQIQLNILHRRNFMKKKLCTMAVSLMVGLSLVACGGNAKQAETGKESEAGTTAGGEKKGREFF